MAAHLLERIESILRVAECDLVCRDQPMIKSQAAVVIHKIVAVDQGIEPVRYSKHFDFILPCGSVIRKILIQRKILNGEAESVREFVDLILNIEFGFSISNPVGQCFFPTIFHGSEQLD